MNRSLFATVAMVPVLIAAPREAVAQLSQPKIVLEITMQPAEGSPGEFASPTGILRTTDGRFVVTDMNAPTVRLYDRTGRFIRDIGRPGAGPGEYRQPMPTLYHDTLVIHDGRLNRVNVMTLDGKSVRTFAVPYSGSCCQPPLVEASGRLVVQGFNGRGSLFRRYALSGSAVDSIIVPQVSAKGEWTFASGGGQASYRIPFAAFTARTMLRDGTMLYGNSREYQLHVTRTGRDTVRLIARRTGSGTPIRPALRDSMFHMLVDRNADLRAVASLNDVPKDYPVWTSAFEDAHSNIWVLLGGGAPSSMQFDVYTHDGRSLGNVTAPFTWNSPNITFMGDRIGVIDSDANDLPRIRIYRIVTN
jgi:hypothetical protein